MVYIIIKPSTSLKIRVEAPISKPLYLTPNVKLIGFLKNQMSSATINGFPFPNKAPNAKTFLTIWSFIQGLQSF